MKKKENQEKSLIFEFPWSGPRIFPKGQAILGVSRATALQLGSKHMQERGQQNGL
jgi:hypothetical protein